MSDPAFYGLLKPLLDGQLGPTSRIHFFLSEFSDILPLLGETFNAYASDNDPDIFHQLGHHLDASHYHLIAVHLPVCQTSTTPTIPAQAFFAAHFDSPSDPLTPTQATWLQWQTLGVPDACFPIWQYLSTHVPKRTSDTITIVSSKGYILYSIHGTTAIFTPTQAISASVGSIWQLSSQGETFLECNAPAPIQVDEIVSGFRHLFDRFHRPTLSGAASTRRTLPPISGAKFPVKSATSTVKKPTRAKKPQLHAKFKRVAHDDTVEMSSSSVRFMSTLTPSSDSNSDLNSGSVMADDLSSDSDIVSNDGSTSQHDDSRIRTPSHSTSTPVATPHYAIEEDPLSHPDEDWGAHPAGLYHGPNDHITLAKCVIIAGFHKSIGYNTNIAKAVHTMLSTGPTHQRLSHVFNSSIQPEYSKSPTVCGFFPLELSNEYQFRRYPQDNSEQHIFRQLHFPSPAVNGFYHHFMAFAIPVSSDVFNSALTIGAFRGVIPNSNFIPVQIEELHKTVFYSDPKIILFPNVLGTNTAGNHDAKYLHETIIMVKSLHKVGISDIYKKFNLHRGSAHNVAPVTLTFYTDVGSMASSLKPGVGISLPSSVVIRHTDSEIPFDVLSVVERLKADPSLPWDSISAILPMDFTTSSARTIETSYFKWHQTDHVVVIHKDGSDQRQLQQALALHLGAQASDLVAKNERHLPGYLDRVFRKYANIATTNLPLSSNQVWMAPPRTSPRIAATPTPGRSWSSAVQSPSSTRTEPPPPTPAAAPTSSPMRATNHRIPQPSTDPADKFTQLEQRLQHLESNSATILQHIETIITHFTTVLSTATTQQAQQFNALASTMAQQTQLLTAILTNFQPTAFGASTSQSPAPTSTKSPQPTPSLSPPPTIHPTPAIQHFSAPSQPPSRPVSQLAPLGIQEYGATHPP